MEFWLLSTTCIVFYPHHGVTAAFYYTCSLYPQDGVVFGFCSTCSFYLQYGVVFGFYSTCSLYPRDGMISSCPVSQGLQIVEEVLLLFWWYAVHLLYNTCAKLVSHNRCEVSEDDCMVVFALFFYSAAHLSVKRNCAESRLGTVAICVDNGFVVIRHFLLEKPIIFAQAVRAPQQPFKYWDDLPLAVIVPIFFSPIPLSLSDILVERQCLFPFFLRWLKLMTHFRLFFSPRAFVLSIPSLPTEVWRLLLAMTV